LGRCDLTWEEVSGNSRSQGVEEFSRTDSCTDNQACGLAGLFPGLETLYLNDNPRITSLGGGQQIMGKTTTLSVEGSGVTRWEDITCGLSSLTRWVRLRRAVASTRSDEMPCSPLIDDRLATLNLSRTPIGTILPPLASYAGSDPNPDANSNSDSDSRSQSQSQSQSRSFGISSLILLDSSLSDWTSIDSLAKWFPNLSSLRFLSLPPSQDTPPPHADTAVHANVNADPRRIPLDPAKARPFLIAKLPRLSQLNSTPVSSNERRDAELFYVGFVGRLASTAGWARYPELCELHGRPVQNTAGTKDTSSSLKSRMISGFHSSMCVIGRTMEHSSVSVKGDVNARHPRVCLGLGLVMSTLTPLTPLTPLSELNVHPTNGTPFHISVLPSTPIALLRRKVARQARLPGTAAIWTARRTTDGGEACEKVVEVSEGAVGDWFADEEDVIVDA
jgi:hypothetical protein